MQTIHQCPHYQRNCEVEAPCCKIFYPCKLCHDDKFQFKKGCQVERMHFQQVDKIRCLQCKNIQNPTTNCDQCQLLFAQYSCLKCKLYQNNPLKKDDIYHCDDCKMCRRGSKDKNIHCKMCGYCVPQKEHKCIENAAGSKCPICLEQMQFSTKYFQSLPCGHLIHVQCLAQLRDINCPSCGMAIQKLGKKQNDNISKQIEATKDKLPQQLLDKKVNILCNQCLHKTMNAAFHFYGIKCQKCGTYNTKMI